MKVLLALIIILLILFAIDAFSNEPLFIEGTLQGFSMRCNSIVNDYIVAIVNNQSFNISKQIYNQIYRKIGKKVIVYYNIWKEINMCENIYKNAYLILTVE